MERYGRILEKRQREIVLLRGSGSVFELDAGTLEAIKETCRKKGIATLHFESHYLYNSQITALREAFSEFALKTNPGLETFDHDFYPRCKRDERMDILIHNTDFCVGD